MFDLTGKTILVTGSSRGLGHTLARGLARAGARLILNGANPERLEKAVADFKAAGHDASGQAFDITIAAATEAGLARAEAEAGPIHVLVNNAGIQRRGKMEDMGEEDWQAVIDTNLTAVWRVSRLVARGMLKRGTGRIINISSLLAFAARPTIAPYTAAKAGVSQLTKSMAVEWSGRGINANAIAPGYFATDMNQSLAADKDFNAWIEMRTPARRWGNPEELVGPAIFLASDAASFVTGQTLYVDGGWTANL